MNRQQLYKDFEAKFTDYIPVIKKNNNADNVSEAIQCSQNNEKNTIVKILTFSEKELFYAPIKVLLNEKRIVNLFSEEFIENKVFEFYHAFLADEENKSALMKELFTNLLEQKPQEYLIISEIENIRILDDISYHLADSTIQLLKEDDLPDIDHTIYSIKDVFNKPAIITKVLAGDNTKACEIALHNYLISFGLLRLYAPNFKPALKDCLLSGNQKLTLFNTTLGLMASHNSKVGDLQLNHAYLSKQLYGQLLDAGIEELTKSNEITKVVKESLYWFGSGLNESQPSAKLLNFVTVLEAVLKKSGEKTEIARAISERGALLLCKEFDDRKNASKQLKKIYRERSTVVHTGTLIDDKNFASVAGGYARSILMKLIKNSAKFNGNFSKFIEHLDDLKFGKKE